MSEVGFVGMGKLGIPVALAIEDKGHHVTGYDVSPDPYKYLADRRIPFKEEGIQPLLDKHQIDMVPTIADVVAASELILVPVQTPHGPEYEGSTRIPETRADFEYKYLMQAIGQIAVEAIKQKKEVDLAVISTCLPGTYNQRIKPLIEGNPYINYVYTPQFIAMGNVIDDYLNPEFNLIGVDSQAAAERLEQFYKTINEAPAIKTDITTAEAIKVSYNTFITMKTVLANAWGEMAHKLGFSADDLYRAWSMSSKRLLSPKYLRAGVGDGGGCHPRDNIALSYLADKIGMSHNLWEDLMAAREEHMAWLADLAAQYSQERDLPVVVMGKAFKPETNIQTGSPAILMANILKDEHHLDPNQLDDDFNKPLLGPAVYVIGVQHEKYKHVKFPRGSVVIDPFRFLPEQEGVDYVKIGQ